MAEAVRLGIPVFGIVDTNSNPNNIDFVIPANDDATKSIEIILNAMIEAIQEGLQERKIEKTDNEEGEVEVRVKEKRSRIAKKVKTEDETDSVEEEKAEQEEDDKE